MQEAPIPDDEERRLALLRACNIIYTPAEQAFDDVAQLASELCGTEIALITLVDADYQWFKARVGVVQPGTARDLSFCGHCITGSHPMVVEDTHADPRFRDNPLVTGDPHIRFYAGVPLEIGEGSAIGALSVASCEPRTLSPRKLEYLRRLAAQISRELLRRRALGRSAASILPDEAPLTDGDVVDGRWRVVREIGRGTAGVVYEANDGEQRAAIKVLLPAWRRSRQFLDRFAREARVLRSLRTPHVGQLIDVGNLDLSRGDLPYLVLEYLEGTDLDRLVEIGGPLDYRRAFAYCADACEAVEEAHGLGIVHRDLKPSNVFLANRPEGPLVKVLDFGIAAADPSWDTLNPRLTQESELLGSPAYMSPEQMVASHDVDVRSDVWSMGALLYELITGQLPFDGATQLAMFANVMMAPPTPIGSHLQHAIPSEAEAIVMRCLEKERSARFPSMAELGAALRSCAVI